MLTSSLTDFLVSKDNKRLTNMPKSSTRKATTAPKSTRASSAKGAEDNTLQQLMARLERLEAERATAPVASTSSAASAAPADTTEQAAPAAARKNRGRAKKQPAPAAPDASTSQSPAEDQQHEVLSAAVRREVTNKFTKTRHAPPPTHVESSSEDSDEQPDTPPRHVSKRAKHSTSKSDHWPNDHIYAQCGQKIAFEDLAWEQFFAGYLAATRLSKHSIQPAMYSHLEILAEDMASFGYEFVVTFPRHLAARAGDGQGQLD